MSHGFVTKISIFLLINSILFYTINIGILNLIETDLIVYSWKSCKIGKDSESHVTFVVTRKLTIEDLKS